MYSKHKHVLKQTLLSGWENFALDFQAQHQMNMSIYLFMFHDLSTPLKALVIKEG